MELLIVDDHPVVRDGLRMMLESNKEKFEFSVSEASSASEALESVANHNYDCIIMDYKLPDKTGDVITKDIMALKPEAKIIGLSNYDEHVYAAEMLSSGARGYVLKNIDSSELITAIEKVMDGQLYYSSDIANRLINMSLQEKNKPKSQVDVDALIDNLSNRELQIIKRIADEMTNEEIANELELSKRTVDNHRQNILSKLRLRNTAGLVRFAVEHKLIKR
ncbi:MAG: response regulator transcription factor [Schleiferiaceae bacterium]|nr:response regulator transcription factor [Schleiferiaceae bacterium]